MMRVHMAVIDKSADTQIEENHTISGTTAIEHQAQVKQLAICLQNLSLTTYQQRVVDNM
jgi:hypothetical protein